MPTSEIQELLDAATEMDWLCWRTQVLLEQYPDLMGPNRVRRGFRKAAKRLERALAMYPGLGASLAGGFKEPYDDRRDEMIG